MLRPALGGSRPPDALASADGPDQALPRRTADGLRRDGRDAPSEMARASDLRVGPALVGRVRDRGSARRPHRARRAGSAHLVFPISIAIAVLLAIVVLSYRQTVQVYESSGGAYIVAKENLGRIPSLVAAAALLTDYVLTVAVSVAAGVLALTSAVSSLRSHELALSLGFVMLIAVANLRGVREAGILFAIPTYGFISAILLTVSIGIGKCASGGCPHAVTPHPLVAGVGAVTLFVVLRAFSSGSTALTGVEAIANGVNAFRRPHGRNAAQTMLALGIVAITMFLGVTLAGRAHPRACRPSPGRRRCSRRSPGRSPDVVGPRVHVLGRAGPRRSQCSFSLRTRRTRASPGSPLSSLATGSLPGSSRTSATGSSSRTGSSS